MPGDEGVTYQRAVALLGVTDGALLDDMVDALAAGDAAAVYGTVDRVVEAGHDPRRFASDLLDRFRDLILLDAVPDAAARGLIDAPQDVAERMADQAARLGGATVTRYAEIVHTALIEMRGTTSPRLVLELLCARMQLPDASADAAALLQRLERLERRATAVGAPVATVAVPAEPRAEAGRRKPAAAPARNGAAGACAEGGRRPSPRRPRSSSNRRPSRRRPPPEPAAVPAGQLDAAALRRLWPDVLEIVKQRSRRTRALLDNAQITGSRRVDGHARRAGRAGEDDRRGQQHLGAARRADPGRRRHVAGRGRGAAPRPSRCRAPDPRRRAGPGASRSRRARARPARRPRRVRRRRAPAPSDPEADAMKLLQDRLGARPVD